jgi:hypothetical protein
VHAIHWIAIKANNNERKKEKVKREKLKKENKKIKWKKKKGESWGKKKGESWGVSCLEPTTSCVQRTNVQK